MSNINLQIGMTVETAWKPLVVAGRKAFRHQIQSDVLVLLPTSTHLDLMQDQTVLWICKNLRAVLGERQFAIEAVLHSQPFRGHELVEDLSRQKRRIGDLFRAYRPKVVMVVGPELIRILKPTVATRSNANIVGYVHPLEFGDKAVAVCVPYLHDQQYVLRNIDEISVDFAKVPFMLDNPNVHKEGTIIKLDTDKSANEYIDFLLNEHNGYLAYDTETRNRNKRYHNRLASMQFATDTDTSYVMYWNHDYNNRSREHDKLVLRPKLRKIFGGHSKIAGLIAHYAVFDISSTRMEFDIDYWGIRTYDTVLITHLLDQNRQRDDRITKPLPGAKPHELKQLVNEFFAYDGYEAETKAARKDGSLIDLPEPRLTKYAGQDGFAEYRIFKFLLHWAKTQGRLDDVMRFSNTIHARAIRTFQNMSYNGMLVDLAYIETLERPDSIINKEIQSVKDKFKSDPVTIRVNEALLKKKTNASHFWQIPWVFDIAKPASKFMLFYDKTVGLGLEPLPDPKKPEEKPKPSCDDHFQQHYSKIPQVKWLTEFSEVEKLRNTYVSKMGAAIKNAERDKTDYLDSRAHSDFNLNGTDTGRLSCIKKGTYVEVLRDLSINPLGIKIEDVKVGDWVYCYTNDGKPTISKVTWSGKTGEDRCVKLIWKSEEGGGFLGELELTADHKVKTVDRGWIQAKDLLPGESVYAMNRYGEDIKFTHENCKQYEYRFIWETVHRRSLNGLHVHHNDLNHYNNVISNLTAINQSDHQKYHGARRSLSRHIKLNTSVYVASRLNRHDINCQISRYQLIRLLFKHQAKPAHIPGYWYSDIIDICKFHNLDWREIQFRFNRNTYLSKTIIKNALDNWAANTGIDPAKKLGIGSRRLKALCAFYGLPYGIKSKKATAPGLAELQYAGLKVIANRTGKSIFTNARKSRDKTNLCTIKVKGVLIHTTAIKPRRVPGNHQVVRVIETPGIHDVYCIEVDRFHNFIASGVCVANSSRPNMQQIPRADNDFKKAVKNTFITPVGTCIVQADFCAAEVRMWGSLSCDAFLCELLTNAFNKRAAYRANPTDRQLEEDAMLMGDVHKQTASLMFGVTLKEVTKALRTVTKGITFGLIYGRGERSIAEQLNKSEQETHELCQKFFAQFPEGVAWLDEQKRFVQQHHYIETPFKRRRYLPWVNDLDRKLQSSALRQSINSPVQSAAGDFATLSISLLDEELHKRRLSKHFKLVNAVHDSTLVESPASADALAEIVPIIRQCFTIRSRDIVHNTFGFETKAPMDIDVEVSQRKAWRCSKCGHTYKYYKSKCDKVILSDDKKPLLDKNGDEIKCAHTERSLVKLNGGWGTLIALDETMSGYQEAALGF